MDVNEILTAAQTLTFEERKRLIQGLFSQMPKTKGLAGTITEVGDLDLGTEAIRTMVQQSLERSGRELHADTQEPDECQCT